MSAAAFRWLTPDDGFPVSYRRGGTAAHLDLSGERGRAVVRAMADQLGLTVTKVEPFGLEGSGGSSPLRRTLEDGTRVLVVTTVHEEGDRVRLSVRDSGVGVESQVLARLFEPFYTTKSDGMGIGLFVSRSIIESHRGSLRVDSDGQTETTFTVELPTTQPTGAAPEQLARAPPSTALVGQGFAVAPASAKA